VIGFFIEATSLCFEYKIQEWSARFADPLKTGLLFIQLNPVGYKSIPTLEPGY
jgi:hypothetical protein